MWTDESEVRAMAKKDTESAVITVSELAKLLRIGRVSAYQAVERGEVPSIRIGRRILVPRAAVHRMLSDIQPKPAA